MNAGMHIKQKISAPWFRAVCAVVWGLLIMGASFLPQGHSAAQTFTLGGRDALAHMVAYGVLTVLLLWAFAAYSRGMRMACGLLLPLALGGLVELVQPLAGRSTGFGDMMANAAGVLGGFALTVLWLDIRRKRDDASAGQGETSD